MPRLRLLHRPDLTAGISRALLVGASVAALMIGSSASAQETTEPDAAQTDAATTSATTAGAPVDGIRATTTTYVPVSEGAVPAEDEATSTQPDSLFADDADESGLRLGPAEPAQPRAPSTARQRATARTQALSLAEPEPTTTEQRTKAEEEKAAEEQEFTTGTAREPTVDSNEDLTIDSGAPAGEPIEGLPPLEEEDPFAAPGIRVGTFILRPSLETGITASSNVNQSVGGGSGVFSDTTLRLNAQSDRSRHSATIDGFVNYERSISGEEINELQGGVDARLNLDFANDWRGTASLNYLNEPETASSPVVIPDTVEDPILQTFGGTAGLEKDVGKVQFGVLGLLEREDYGNAELIDGTSLSQKDRNNTLGTITLRGGYEISPAVTPYVEVELGQRHYSEEVDTSGYRRSSDRFGARGGIALDLNEKLIGELNAGWIQEDFDDERLLPNEGPTVGANLNWSPERDTNVNLYAATIVESTTTPGESGSLLYDGKLSLTRQIRANLTGLAAIGGGYRNYTGSDGHDWLFNAEIGATWWLNRYAGLTGRLAYESLESNLPDRDYDASSAFLGLTVRR